MATVRTWRGNKDAVPLQDVGQRDMGGMRGGFTHGAGRSSVEPIL